MMVNFTLASVNKLDKKMVMKTIIPILFIIFAACSGFSQKFGYIDTEFILKKVPEYAEAQKEISKLSVEEQRKIEKMYLSLDSMYAAYRRDEILLTEEMKDKRLKQIDEEEETIKAYQKKIFGIDGRIFLKRQELIKPVQDMVFEAVEKVAQKHKLQIVFDKSSDVNMIYANPTHDYTDYVLEALGLGEKENQIDNERYQEK